MITNNKLVSTPMFLRKWTLATNGFRARFLAYATVFRSVSSTMTEVRTAWCNSMCSSNSSRSNSMPYAEQQLQQKQQHLAQLQQPLLLLKLLLSIGHAVAAEHAVASSCASYTYRQEQQGVTGLLCCRVSTSSTIVSFSCRTSYCLSRHSSVRTAKKPCSSSLTLQSSALYLRL